MEGNNKAMRKALFDIVMLTMKVGHSIRGDIACGIIASKAKHALSAPLRNCDVGSAEEQEKRFKHFCAQNYSACDVDMECCRCPIEREKADCEFAWAQMPYAEGGEK